MSKFRMKPIVVEAEQWFPGKDIDGVIPENYLTEIGGPMVALALTPNGHEQVLPDDWVIMGINGERYVCKHNLFEKIFEPVNE